MHNLFERAKNVIPGGVNSPVRACSSVGTDPIFITHGDGCMVRDESGNSYVDLIGSWGPLILGHANPLILDAISEAMHSGTTFGAPTEIEVKFAEELCHAVPSIDMVRAVSSGTEATMSACRLARGFTQREKIIKIDGGYHGHADFLLVAAGSGAATLGLPGSAGVTKGAAQDTILVPFNDLAAIEKAYAEHKDQIAALIVEPIAGNMGCVPPKAGYLEGLRKITEANKSVLIFDEVMTCFRVSYGGAQALYGVTPDLTCLGKIVGGGLPLAAFGGKKEIMNHLAPLGAVYQAGTLSGNPMAVAAGLKTIEILRRSSTYSRLEEISGKLANGLGQAAMDNGINHCINRVGSMLTFFFNKGPVTDYPSAKASDTKVFAKYYQEMRKRGINLPPSQFEAMFVSLSHTDETIDKVVNAASETFKLL